MRIEKFTPAMQKQVIAFIEKCFAALGWGYDPNGRNVDTAKVDEYYMKSGCFWCLFDGEVLIGTVALRTIDYENKVFELKRMFVLPEYQRKGCGALLLNTAISYAKAQNYRSIRLDTRSDLLSAQKLYEKNGFKKTEQYNSNSYADIYYQLNLSEI